MKTKMPSLNRKPITILLVEDDPAHAEIVRRNLSEFPVAHRFVHVEDGQMALDYLFGGNPGPPPALILLDLRLPKVDGLEVLRQIHEDEALKAIPLVVLTTSAADSDLAAAYHLGATSYQLKPANFEGYTELLAANLPQKEKLHRRPIHE
ncbi:MAG: response regulator [Verrucomicrobiota bacterium]